MAGTPKKSSPAKDTNSSSKKTPSKKDSPSKNDSSSSPKNSPSKKEDSAAKALELYAQGKRHLLVNDVNSAVNSLQEACRMLAAQHGETAPELGDAYFYYGRALLELARIENGVLGNALEGVPEGEDKDEDLDSSQFENPDKMSAEEKEKVAEQVEEALEDNIDNLENKSSPSKDAEKGDAKDKEVDGDTDEPMEDDKKEKSPAKNKDAKKSPAKDKKDESAMDTDSKKDGESKDESEDESQEEDDESQEEDTEEGKAEGEKAEDVSNLQLAWEILELAKVIYQKQEEGNKEMSLKAAQVFLKLGEVGLESENYARCIEDFQSCLKIQEKHMKSDDRCIAETHYQLGVSHSFNDDFDKSIESFTKASKIIEDRIANLEKRKKEMEGWTEEQKKKETDSLEDPLEIKELNNLLPEIKEKITDMEEMKKDSKDKINKVKKELGKASEIGGTKETESSSNGFGSSRISGDAKTVGASMITKKRKPEDEAEGDDAKKTKAENGAKNGHSSPDKMDTDKKSTDELKIKAAKDMEEKTKELKKQTA